MDLSQVLSNYGIDDTYNIEPWPSTYVMKGELEPKKLKSRFQGRRVGAVRIAIPSKTVEPPQIHLIARDGYPFEELITDFEKSFLVLYFDPEIGEFNVEECSPGEDIKIPTYQIHWLINRHDTELEFTVEYAPHPWHGKDEPEFPNLKSLLRALNEGIFATIK